MTEAQLVEVGLKIQERLQAGANMPLRVDKFCEVGILESSRGCTRTKSQP